MPRESRCNKAINVHSCCSRQVRPSTCGLPSVVSVRMLCGVDVPVSVWGNEHRDGSGKRVWAFYMLAWQQQWNHFGYVMLDYIGAAECKKRALG